MKTEQVSIQCGGIELDGVLSIPVNDDPIACVAVCHPHPAYGGDMNNNVVTAICEGLTLFNVASLRFNFRSTSSNSKAEIGQCEKDDVKAVIDYLGQRPEIDEKRIGLTGYSFGGVIAFEVAKAEKKVKALALVSPALDNDGWKKLYKKKGSLLVLLGDRDDVIPVEEKRQYFDKKDNFVIIAGADHFYSGFENTVGMEVGGFIHDNL